MTKMTNEEISAAASSIMQMRNAGRMPQTDEKRRYNDTKYEKRVRIDSILLEQRAIKDGREIWE